MKNRCLQKVFIIVDFTWFMELLLLDLYAQHVQIKAAGSHFQNTELSSARHVCVFEHRSCWRIAALTCKEVQGWRGMLTPLSSCWCRCWGCHSIFQHQFVILSSLRQQLWSSFFLSSPSRYISAKVLCLFCKCLTTFNLLLLARLSPQMKPTG